MCFLDPVCTSWLVLLRLLPVADAPRHRWPAAPSILATGGTASPLYRVTIDSRWQTRMNMLYALFTRYGIRQMPVPKKKPKPDEKLRENEKKWGRNLVKVGWTLVPSTILERQQELGLDPIDLNILLQIARYWWKAGQPPFPAISSIARCIGRSISTVQRRPKTMETRGLITIEHRYDESHGGQTSSRYIFNGLIEVASRLANETLEERQLKRTERKARRRPKTGDTKLKIHRQQ